MSRQRSCWKVRLLALAMLAGANLGCGNYYCVNGVACEPNTQALRSELMITGFPMAQVDHSVGLPDGGYAGTMAPGQEIPVVVEGAGLGDVTSFQFMSTDPAAAHVSPGAGYTGLLRGIGAGTTTSISGLATFRDGSSAGVDLWACASSATGRGCARVTRVKLTAGS